MRIFALALTPPSTFTHLPANIPQRSPTHPCICHMFKYTHGGVFTPMPAHAPQRLHTVTPTYYLHVTSPYTYVPSTPMPTHFQPPIFILCLFLFPIPKPSFRPSRETYITMESRHHGDVRIIRFVPILSGSPSYHSLSIMFCRYYSIYHVALYVYHTHASPYTAIHRLRSYIGSMRMTGSQPLNHLMI